MYLSPIAAADLVKFHNEPDGSAPAVNERVNTIKLKIEVSDTLDDDHGDLTLFVYRQ